MIWTPRWPRWIAAALLVAAVAAAPAVTGQVVDRDKPLDAFFGSFDGQTVFATGTGLNKRDVNVVIRPRGQGFSLAWTTITQKTTGKIKRAETTVNFQPSGRPGIFAADDRIDGAGAAVPRDPLDGEPFVWARIKGATLSVFALVIGDGGGYEMQTYERTVTDDGLNLRFARIRDGKPLKLITARLKRR